MTGDQSSVALTAAVGGAGGAATVDVGDATVVDGDEVVNGLAESLVVGGADDVDGAVADGAGHHDHGQVGGQVGRVGRGCLRAGVTALSASS